MTVRWHIVKSTTRFGAWTVQDSWNEERAGGLVTAGYGNAPAGKGRDVLRRYRPGDIVLAYAPKFGAIGVGEILDIAPEHIPNLRRDQHAHHRAVRWHTALDRLMNAVPAHAIRAVGGYSPRTLGMRLREPTASAVIRLIEAAATRR